MKSITHLVLLLWCVIISLQGPVVPSGDKITSNEAVTVSTIQPQNGTNITPKRVEPVLPDGKPTENANLSEKAKNSSSLNTSTTTTLPTTEGSTEKQEEEDDDNQEEQKPPTVEEEKPGKIDESKKVQPKEEAKEVPKVQESKGVDDDLAEPEDSNFLSFMLIGLLLVFCIYLLQHNKKKILGLMFEGRTGGGGSRRGNVRYRKLSQKEEEPYKEDIIY